MAWDKMAVLGRGAAMVTIRSSSIAFSAYFINSEKLIFTKYVEVFEDIELRRIGFKFTDNPKSFNALALKQDGGKKGERNNNGRLVFTDLKRKNWICSSIEKGCHRYRILRDSNFDTNRLFFIELGYTYSNIIDFNSIELFPEISGVYRLFNEKKELIRIGEGQNIKSRLLTHKKNDSQNDIKSLDFCEIQESLLRKTEERRLLIDFKEKHGGFLPELNSITA